jgi:hypothetical protein
MFKKDNPFQFLKTPEYTVAPVLGTWKAYYIVSVSIFVSELALFTFLSCTY